MTADTEALALIERIRSQIRAIDYEPLGDAALAEMHAQAEAAAEDAESEGVMRTARLSVLHEMLIEERAPQAMRDVAVEHFMVAVAAEATGVGL